MSGATLVVQPSLFDLTIDTVPTILTSRTAYAVGRFNPDGPTGYRASTAPDAPLRGTRAEAEADERLWRERAA